MKIAGFGCAGGYSHEEDDPSDCDPCWPYSADRNCGGGIPLSDGRWIQLNLRVVEAEIGI